MIIFNPDRKAFFSTKIDDDNVISGFCTRDAGDALRPETVLAYLNEMRINHKKVIVPEQIHSVNVSYIVADNPVIIENIADTDGVVTRERNVVLTVRTADCIPMVFSDKQNAVIGISHQGWRGSLKKMVKIMVEKMVDVGCRKEDIITAMGPSIGQCCYDVDDDRYVNFMEELNGYSEKIFIVRHGKRYLDLSLLNYILLLEAGIPQDNIDFFPFCTSCDSKRFFSLRRDGKKNLQEMLSYIVQY